MLHLITGGSGSGKSAFAEACIVKAGHPERIYIATMYPFDEESYKRIARHQEMRREKCFQTVECYTGLANLQIPKGASVLLECLSNLTANEMYHEAGAGPGCVQAILEGIEMLQKQAGHLIIVTNEIFTDGCTYDEETSRYQSYLGQINRELGKSAGRVTEVVYGIPVELKQSAQEKRNMV